MRPGLRRLVPAALLASAACGLSDEAAVRLVEAYDRQLADAYRSGDVRRVEGVAAMAQQRKLTGLIGVNLDRGVTLDAQLLDFEVRRVEREGGLVYVHTRERWHYVERRIGSGEPAGEPSTDAYEVRYELRKTDGRWLVAALEFTAPPVVGRPQPLPALDVPVAHGIETRAPPPAADAPATPPGSGR